MTVTGNATRSSVLRVAGVTQASALVVAVNRDDTAVLVTLTARELSPNVRIVASVRESENVHLLRQSGASSVVVSAETAGRLLGMATTTPSVVEVVEDLLTPDAGFAISEREVEESEVGGSPRHLTDIVLGVVRERRAAPRRRLDRRRAGAGRPAALRPQGLAPRRRLNRRGSVCPVRVATWNVNSVLARLPRLLPWLDERAPDVVCLQETKLSDEAFADALAAPLAERGYADAHHGQGQWNGVALLSRVGLDDVVRGLPDEPRFPTPTPRRTPARSPPPARACASPRSTSPTAAPPTTRTTSTSSTGSPRCAPRSPTRPPRSSPAT